jgi:hypothetical protein
MVPVRCLLESGACADKRCLAEMCRDQVERDRQALGAEATR